MATPIDEAQWLLRAQCQDREALELLLRSVQPPLRRYISGLIGADDADDILQGVLLIVSRKLYWLEQPQLFRAWAFRIASRNAKLLSGAAFAQMAFIGGCAVLVSYHVTRMTRTVLNAIDLASKK